MVNPLPTINFPELVFGLVAPIGTVFEPTVTSFEKKLVSLGYNVVTLSVTEMFKAFAEKIIPKEELNETTKYERYKSYISYGNQLRTETGDNSIMALAAMYQISSARAQAEGSRDAHTVNRPNAFIIRQFKRPEEIDLLRAVYGEQFFQISIYSTRPNRVTNLSSVFAKDVGAPNPESETSKAYEVVQIDQGQSDTKTGQRLRKTFHNADFIVDANVSATKVGEQVDRFVELLFGSNSISPTKIEYGMKLAKSAALRSIDLSRQVGAAIFDDTGQIISLGSNEVPKAGGGTYWCDDTGKRDAREYTKNLDSNDERKKELLKEILEFSGIVEAERDEKTKRIIEKLSGSQFMDALEYGRVVHAEMSALTDAARKGLPVKDSTLYCTTFPCHLCAKHIVSSGVSTVVFLEPYPKSLVARLHQDSIEVEDEKRGEFSEFKAVRFKHFHGITPRIFDAFFYRGKRKNSDGTFRPYKDDDPKPIIEAKDMNFLLIEAQLIENSIERIIAPDLFTVSN